MFRFFSKNNGLLIFAVCLTVVLSACQTTSYRNPWNKQGHTEVAQQAPKALSGEQALEHAKASNGLIPLPENQALAGYQNDQFSNISNNNTFMDGMDPSIVPGTTMDAVSQPTIKIGLLVPLTGEHSNIGTGMLNSAQLALFDIGNDQFELLPRDTMGTSQGAKMAAQDAIDSGAQILLGPVFSHSVRSVKSIAKRNDVNLIAFSTDWSLADRNTFIMGFLPFAQVERVAEYAISKGYQNVGILAPHNPYGNAVIAAYNSAAYQNGLPAAKVTKFPVGERDISNVVRSFTEYDMRVEALNQLIRPLQTRLKLNPNDRLAKQELEALEDMETWGPPPYDAVLLPVGGDLARSIANLLSYYDLPPQTVQRLGTGLWDDEGLAAEPGLKGAWYAAAPASSRATFETKYRSLYREAPPRLSTLAYDATALSIVLATNSLRSTGEVRFTRDNIINPNGFAGLDGIFRFRPDGNVERGLAVLELDSGQINILDDAPSTFQRMQNF